MPRDDKTGDGDLEQGENQDDAASGSSDEARRLEGAASPTPRPTVFDEVLAAHAILPGGVSDATGIENPISSNSSATFDTEEDAAGLSISAMLAKMDSQHQHALSEDDIALLTKAFGACDIDAGGDINVEELNVVLRMLGAALTEDECTTLMRHTNVAYRKWAHSVGIDPEEKFFMEDLKEQSLLNVVPDTNRGLRAVQVWNPFSNEYEERVSTPLFHRFHVDKLLLAPKRTTKAGARLAKGSVKAIAALSPRRTPGKDEADEEAEISESKAEEMAKSMTLDFREFVFMMNTEILGVTGLDDWRASAMKMYKLRRAYDSLEINGDNELSEEELQMVRGHLCAATCAIVLAV